MPLQERHIPARPPRLKVALSRTGFVYLWARRLRAAARYARRHPHDPDFAAFGELPGDGLFLDIGASIGQSALSFRIFNRRSPILSLEPLPEHRGDLRFVGRLIRGQRFLMVGAAEESRTATLFVPMLDSYELPAEASLHRGDAENVIEQLAAQGEDPARLGLKEVTVELRRLDELELEPQFVKIDVEGAELGVLEGMRETIRRCYPVLMIEKSERAPRVIELLAEDGYSPFVFDPTAKRMLPYEGQPAVNLFYLAGDASLRASAGRP